MAAGGDIAKPDAPGKRQTQTAGLITNVIQPSRVFALGDEQYPSGEFAQFLASYDPTWGVFKGMTVPVPGNHEYATPNAAGYFQYFGSVLSPFGATATDPAKGYYSFNLGDWHIVAINSNCFAIDCPSELSWIQQDLAADSHLCELALYHHPIKKFAKPLAAQGVDLALVGHKHVYERWNDVFGLNLRELIVGTGGKSLGTIDPAADAERARVRCREGDAERRQLLMVLHRRQRDGARLGIRHLPLLMQPSSPRSPVPAIRL